MRSMLPAPAFGGLACSPPAKKPLFCSCCATGTTGQSGQLLTALLQQELCLSSAAAQTVTAAAVKLLDETEVEACASNVEVLARLFPRSAARSLEKLVLSNPSVLLAPLESWHDFLAAYGVSQQTFCSLILWHAAHIITASTPFAAGTVILTLQNWGLSSTDINSSVLMRYPQVLLLQQQQLQELQKYLMGACGISKDRLRDLVVAAPKVLLEDIHEQLQPRVAFVQQALAANPEQMSAMLQKATGLLLLADSHSYIQPRLQQLQQFGFTRPQLLQLLSADVGCLAYSTSTLQRKWQYLATVMGMGVDQVLKQCPSYFSKNLMVDVGPRYSFVVLHALQHHLSCAEEQQQGQLQQADTQHQHQAQRQQQQEPHSCIHLGKLLEPSVPDLLAALGKAGNTAEYAAFAQHWAETEGLKWTAVRAL